MLRCSLPFSHRRNELARIYRPNKAERDAIIAKRDASGRHAPAPLVRWKSAAHLIEALGQVRMQCKKAAVSQEDPFDALADRVKRTRLIERIRDECEVAYEASLEDAEEAADEAPADRDQRVAAMVSAMVDAEVKRSNLQRPKSERDWTLKWKAMPLFEGERDAIVRVLDAAIEFLSHDDGAAHVAQGKTVSLLAAAGMLNRLPICPCGTYGVILT